MIITAHAHARAGLVGNPSDGYFGKTISCIIRNFRATVRLWESPQFEIRPGSGDLGRFESVSSFLRDLKLHGYYGGMRLIKAALKKFSDYCRQHELALPDRSFTIEYESDIPRLVGMAGSSAIVTATLRALMQFYSIDIPKHLLPTIILSAEKDELGINAGLQDRVIQTYEGIVYMDFDRAFLEKNGYGIYEPLRPPQEPPLYVAFDPARAEISDLPHSTLRARWNAGDPQVHAAMRKLAEITDVGKKALMDGDWEMLGQMINANFDMRRTIMAIAPENQRMVDVARSTGASASFSGSGGAIVGLFKDGRQYQQLSDALAENRCTVLRPLVFE